MTRRPSDRELDRLLAGLPRASAPPGFSRRVLEHLEAPTRPATRRGWRLAAATAAAAAVLAAALWLLPRPAAQPPGADRRALEREHALLMEELESLKASLRASQPAPVLYLGGTESVDLVLDLRPVLGTEAPAEVRPAVLGAGERTPATRRREGDRR